MKDQNKLLKLLTVAVFVYVIGTAIVGISGKGAGLIMPFLAISFGVFIFAHGTVHYGQKIFWP